MTNFISPDAIGALVDPAAINKSQITAESLYCVVAGLGATELEQFERDLWSYDRGGAPSDLLLGILAVAAGKKRGSRKPVTTFELRSNVVGVLFSDAQPEAS